MLTGEAQWAGALFVALWPLSHLSPILLCEVRAQPQALRIYRWLPRHWPSAPAVTLRTFLPLLSQA